MRKIEESKTVKFTKIIQDLREEGKEIIDFAVGEPDLDTPDDIIRATKKALDEKQTRYSPVSGITRLKILLAKKHGCRVENLLISNGSKQALFNIIFTLCQRGDEVIIPRPYWVTFPQQVLLAGAKPVFSDTIDHQLDVKDIEKKISNKTKAIVINSPNNPTGAVYRDDDLMKICKMADEHGFYIISDDAYEALIYDGLKRFDIMKHAPDKTIMVKSFSKSYSMTGFRLGYVVADELIVREMNRLQSHTTGNVCTFAQFGGVAALGLDEGLLDKRRKIFEIRRDLAYEQAAKLFDCIKPQGAFFLFADISRIGSGEKMSELLLKKAGVAVVAGEYFGMKNHMRISFACSQDNIKKGFEKIGEVL